MINPYGLKVKTPLLQRITYRIKRFASFVMDKALIILLITLIAGCFLRCGQCVSDLGDNGVRSIWYGTKGN
jgi:hypothetical protein